MSEKSHIVSTNDDVLEIRFQTSVGFAEILAAFDEAKDSTESKWIWIFEQGGTATGDELKGYTNYAVNQMADREPRRVAIVAPEDFAFGMARMLEAFSQIEGSKDERDVFRSEAEATQWLHRTAEEE